MSSPLYLSLYFAWRENDKCLKGSGQTWKWLSHNFTRVASERCISTIKGHRAFSIFKMAGQAEKALKQGCQDAPRIVEYFVKSHKIKCHLQGLFPEVGSQSCFDAI